MFVFLFNLFYFLFKGPSICYKHLSREFLKEKKAWKWTQSWITQWDPGQVVLKLLGSTLEEKASVKNNKNKCA